MFCGSGPIELAGVSNGDNVEFEIAEPDLEDLCIIIIKDENADAKKNSGHN